MSRNLRCGYHAWTYYLGGRLVTAPNLATMADIDRDNYGLFPVRLREWLGYAWVCLAAEPPSFEDTVIGAVSERLGAPDAIGRYRVNDLALGRRITYEVAANWKLIVENFMECYHCATIHPEPARQRGYVIIDASPASSQRENNCRALGPGCVSCGGIRPKAMMPSADQNRRVVSSPMGAVIPSSASNEMM